MNNNCIYFKQKFNGNFECKKSKNLHPFKDCNGCKYKEYKPINYKMKNKTNKLAKLEKNRFSLFTDDLTKCYFCHNPKDHIHEIFAGRNRQNSMRLGLCLPICNKCHEKLQNDTKMMNKWYIKGQKMYICYYKKDIDDFINIFGKSFL